MGLSQFFIRIILISTFSYKKVLYLIVNVLVICILNMITNCMVCSNSVVYYRLITNTLSTETSLVQVIGREVSKATDLL